MTSRVGRKRRPKAGSRPDRATRQAIDSPADEIAVTKYGARFDEERAQFVVDWIQRYCHLYEGEYAGQKMLLRDWQLKAVRELFGWVVWSEKWGRWVRRFRRGSIWVPKKNKKSPTLAAIGLYLLCGDGEPGQHVYLCAKDGMQARQIVGEHAIQMVRFSPELKAECDIHIQTYRITHIPTASWMQPLSSSSGRTQAAKEGINGSVLIDETHVVDDSFVRRISRAGISRSEPLHLEVSTAGFGEGYGRQQFLYGRQVSEGLIEDPRYYFLAYHAPQDLDDAELASDPEKYLKMANPAWGHTIDPEEILDDYRRSCKIPGELTTFKVYRLNIWAGSERPWIDRAKWQACYESFSEEELEGMDCVLGLDLSKTRDLTSACLAFPDPYEKDVVRMVWYHWIPRNTLKAMDDKLPVWSLALEDKQHINVTDGDVIDYASIRRKISELADRYRIREIVYDPWNAEQFTQELVEGVRDGTGKIVVPGLNIDRVQFGQSIGNYNEPTKEFERRVLTGKIRHNGNRLVEWQVANCTVKQDNNGNLRPVKPKKDDWRKVDAVVAAIMALARVMKQEPRGEYKIFAL